MSAVAAAVAAGALVAAVARSVAASTTVANRARALRRLDDAGRRVPPTEGRLATSSKTPSTVRGTETDPLTVESPKAAGMRRWLSPTLLRVVRARRARQLDEGLPLALEATARSLRGGCSLAQALAAAGTTVGGAAGNELAGVAKAAGRGVPLSVALDQWRADKPSPAVRLTAGALALAAAAGGTQARAVDGVAATLRERLAVDAEIRALSSQARLSALVIAVAPVAFAALAAAADPRTAEFLVRPGLGWACLLGGLLLDGLAAWWMARLTRSVTP